MPTFQRGKHECFGARDSGLQYGSDRRASSRREFLTPELDLRFEGTTTGCDAQIEQTLRIASGARRIESPADVWNARSTLWSGAEPSVVCKFSLLPGGSRKLLRFDKESIGAAAFALGGSSLRRSESDTFGLRGPIPHALLNALQDFRKNLETRGGSLVILRCPLEIKSKMDVWGSAGDALPLMRSIKAQFDPTGVLNPGRFIGGI
jgi:glycolate oxidase FAD binding subunit